MVNESKIIKLVEEELKNYLAQSKISPGKTTLSPGIQSDRNILIVFTGTDIGLTEIPKQIQILRDKGYGFSLALTQQASRIPGKNKISEITGISNVISETDGQGILNILNNHIGIAIATLSRNTALKLSYGITDSFILYLIYLGIVSKKAIVATKNGVDPSESEIAKWGLPHPPKELISTIINQLNKLEQYGVRLVGVNQLAEEMDKSIKISTGTIDKPDVMTPYGTERPLYTEREIKEAAKKGIKKITIQPGTIITPLARDMAKQLGIIIE